MSDHPFGSRPEQLDPERTVWDVIIVGTGMGGATLGHALGQRGRRILFVEKGRTLADPDTIRGLTPEERFDLATLPLDERREVLARSGRSGEEVAEVSREKPQRFIPEIGCGAGGSTALYGMVLERLFPADFTARAQHPNAPETTLPESWPIRYEDLRPWYAEAERLYRVRGTSDPLRAHEAAASLLSPPTLTRANADLFAFLQGQGLHPYRMHLACEQVPSCQTCQGFLCHQPCKNDAGRICLAPAVNEQGAVLLSHCTALELEASATAVDRLICQWRDRKIALRGRCFVLAAGALATPVLLLRSRSVHWPHGLANRSDLIGRNLMRHLIDLVVLRPKLSEPVSGQTKELALNDFYAHEGRKFGTVQSVGGLPPFAHYLAKLGGKWRFLRFFAPLLRPLWDHHRVRVVVLATILEDLPYAENRVLPGDAVAGNGASATRFSYRLHEYERRRAAEFRQAVTRAVEPYRPFALSVAEDNKVLAHACGTCRFGTDPKTSVLNAQNRAHDLDNLYVVDASFFPTSGGVNPSLTIAANALRVAAHLDQLL